MRREQVTGGVLWANLHLLFWLSLFPFATGWMGENHFAPAADGAVRRGAADGGDRILGAAADDHRVPKAPTRCSSPPSEETGRAKLSPLLYLFAIVSTSGAMARTGDLYSDGAGLAGSRPSHRTCAPAKTNVGWQRSSRAAWPLGRRSFRSIAGEPRGARRVNEPGHASNCTRQQHP